MLLAIFGIAVDVMAAKKVSKNLMLKLQSPLSPDLRKLSIRERQMHLKLSKAMTGLQFRVAGFGNYSWAVLLRGRDEMLRQMLFSLSL